MTLNIGQSQKSLRMAHPLMPVIICATYENNPTRTADVQEQTQQDVHVLHVLLQSRMTLKIWVKVKGNAWDTPFHASNHLWQPWKESIQKALQRGPMDHSHTNRQTDKKQAEFRIPHQLCCGGYDISEV